ncbi:MAG: class I SAM-dependent methyltransferase [Planctomycetes bacterium]|nr:class I SAM-dependent methyltransferase [Planctomycetota bacterium]
MAEYAFKGAPGSSHRWAIEEVARLPAGPLRVLDVGAGRGHVARALLRARPALEVWGVEPGDDARRDLASVAAQALAALDEVPAGAGFDAALLLDVLEHVATPEALLADVVARVRPGGRLLVSVPNVAHWSMRAALLAGEFPYAERGILDRTHVRFFTRRSLGALLRGAGLVVEAESASIVPLELALPAGLAGRAPGWLFARRLRQALARAAPGLCAFQLLARARRP